MLAYLSRNLETAAAGKCVVLLHAFPLSAEMWAPQIDALAEAGYAVLAPQIYGVGDSTEKAKWQMLDFAADVFALINSLGIGKAGKVAVVGLSMGGYAALALHKAHANLIDALVLCDTRAEADAAEAKAERFKFIDALGEHGNEEAVKRMIPKFFAQDTYTTKPELAEQLSDVIRQPRVSVLQSQLEAMAERPDSVAHLASVACPTLVIVGEEDSITPVDAAETLHRGIAGSELAVIKSAGHLSNLEQPVAFNNVLLPFLETALTKA